MGRSPCCDKMGLKKGPWTPEEDQKLLAYVEEHGHGNWRALPSKAGLQRCGKSCRLRWTNYLRPDIKRGKFSLQEEQTIIQLHALLGNRWSAIATHLPKRTDNEIKNYWNTHLKKRLAKMGIDPVTHKPKNDALVSNGSQSKNSANLSHMAQWESARLEAEARLARQSKLRSNPLQSQPNLQEFYLRSSSSTLMNNLNSTSSPPPLLSQNTPDMAAPGASTRCLDALRTRQHGAPWPNSSSEGTRGGNHSPKSTLSFSENGPVNAPGQADATAAATGGGESPTAMIEFLGNNSGSSEQEEGLIREEGSCEDKWKGIADKNSNHLGHEHHQDYHNDDNDHPYNDGVQISVPTFTSGLHDISSSQAMGNFIEGFTEHLLGNFSDRNLSSDDGDGGTGGGNGSNGSSGGGSECCGTEDNKSYWNSILNLVNSSPSNSPLF